MGGATTTPTTTTTTAATTETTLMLGVHNDLFVAAAAGAGTYGSRLKCCGVRMHRSHHAAEITNRQMLAASLVRICM